MMAQEWNQMLDEAKRTSLPEPYADASLGQTLRALVRERRPSYAALEMQLAERAAAEEARRP